MLVRVTDVRVQRDRGRHADLFECQSALEPAREVVTGGQLLQQPGWAGAGAPPISPMRDAGDLRQTAGTSVRASFPIA